MRELVIENLTLVIDAHETDAVSEAHRVIAQVNAALRGVDGSPVLLLSGRVQSEYRENGEE